MPKKLELTPRIKELITSASDGVDPNNVSVYEAISINSLPVRKKGTLFDGAVHSTLTLQEMAAVVARRPSPEHVPVHKLHDQGYELPVGKTFHAEFIDTNGIGEVRSLFYLPNTETVLVDKLESGAIEEVSVGVRYKHINCSQCGWDFLGEDASDENIWMQTCGNDHEIGVDGTHVMLNGLDRWMEQSLVSLGAAKGAKIVGRTKSLLGVEKYNALAASGHNPSLSTLYASATPRPTKELDMDLTELIKELTNTKTSLALKEGEVATLKASADKIPELEKQIATLTTENTALKATGVEALTKDRADAIAHIRKEADRLAVAAGKAKLADTATLVELTASIDDHRKTLTDRFPTGGRAEGSTTTLSAADEDSSASFKTRR